MATSTSIACLLQTDDPWLVFSSCYCWLTFMMLRVSVLSQVCSRSRSPANGCKEIQENIRPQRSTNKNTQASPNTPYRPMIEPTRAAEEVMLTMTTLTCYNSRPKMATHFEHRAEIQRLQRLSQPPNWWWQLGRLLTQSSRDTHGHFWSSSCLLISTLAGAH